MPTAIVMPAPHRPLERREFDLPSLEPGGVLLETLFSEVCGTDVHLWHGRLAGVPYPIIPGHVSIGRIAAMNGAVKDVEGQPFALGDTVAFLDVHGSCGCTVARDWPKHPVKPGEEGSISVTFDTDKRSGHQEKLVTVVANTWPASTALFLHGEVIAPAGTLPVE